MTAPGRSDAPTDLPPTERRNPSTLGLADLGQDLAVTVTATRPAYAPGVFTTSLLPVAKQATRSTYASSGTPAAEASCRLRSRR